MVEDRLGLQIDIIAYPLVKRTPVSAKKSIFGVGTSSIVRTKNAHVPETEVINVEQDNVGSLEVLTRYCRTPKKKDQQRHKNRKLMQHFHSARFKCLSCGRTIPFAYQRKTFRIESRHSHDQWNRPKNPHFSLRRDKAEGICIGGPRRPL